MRTWLEEFLRQHPEYREKRIVKKTRGSVHFELAPGLVEAHFTARPMHEDPDWLRARGWLNLWRESPRAALQLLPALPFGVTYQPDAATGLDTYLYSGTATRNFGITQQMLAGSTTVSYYRSLIAFSGISGIPLGATIASATLTLYCNTVSINDALDIDAHRGLTQWYEGNADNAVPGAGVDASTWNLRNANGAVAWAGGAGGGSGSDYSASVSAATTVTVASAFYDWTGLATDVDGWVNQGWSNYGWWLIPATTANNRKTFRTSDYATNPAQYPALTVTYTTGYKRSFAVWAG